jgi:protein-tyrosine phosphatase
MGNICRSPSGEGVFKALAEKEGLSDMFFIDSAGTSAYHVGEPADKRMRKHASMRNIELTSRSRKFIQSDFENFDYILAMDYDNYQDIIHLDKSGAHHKKVFMMNDFSQKHKGADVPDPYYGGADGFERVLDMLEDSCLGLLEWVKKDNPGL